MKTFFLSFLLLFPGLVLAAETAAPATETAESEAEAAPQIYTNPLSKITLEIPAGFKATGGSDTAVQYVGPTVEGKILSINISTTPVPTGLPEGLMYKTNLESYRNNTTQYAKLQEVSLSNAQAFRVEETPKTSPSELHRAHLFVWARGYETNILFAGSYAGVQKSVEMMNKLFGSVKAP